MKSKKDRGVSGGTAQVMSDVSAYLRKFLPAFPEASSSASDEVPTFLVGHSMGGQAVIYHAAHHPSPAVRGYVAMAPWIRLPSDVAPNKLTVISGQFAARFMPNFQVWISSQLYATCNLTFIRSSRSYVLKCYRTVSFTSNNCH